MCNTMSYQQTVFLVACFGIFTILTCCQCSDLTDRNDYLQKVENSKQNVNKLAALLAEELMNEDKTPIEGREKRVFCNGFFGCSNGRKRSQSGSLDIAPLNYPIDEPEVQPSFRKRLFCNTGGCFGKRSGRYRRFLEKLGKTGKLED
ncbi:uncharacterized protein LOC133180552 [Saccostrea echinata]|uniref:uncharacterized protein LOC133180552 n=1 Tax=Saccostrea echinata TaxID=191078 RepID=UPI002A8193E5|nr:uncharacterized protein LOC133180552 [Saccostrea echinata]